MSDREPYSLTLYMNHSKEARKSVVEAITNFAAILTGDVVMSVKAPDEWPNHNNGDGLYERLAGKYADIPAVPDHGGGLPGDGLNDR